MAQAMNRFPMDARAKCKGTRSGVSITRVSSEVIAADIMFYGKGSILLRGCKMGRWMVFPEDPDDDAVETTQFMHGVVRVVGPEISLSVTCA
jgi:hypothetical protein